MDKLKIETPSIHLGAQNQSRFPHSSFHIQVLRSQVSLAIRNVNFYRTLNTKYAPVIASLVKKNNLKQTIKIISPTTAVV